MDKDHFDDAYCLSGSLGVHGCVIIAAFRKVARLESGEKFAQADDSTIC
jgi:hypothetical protein